MGLGWRILCTRSASSDTCSEMDQCFRLQMLGPQMNPDQLKRLFPNASASTLARNGIESEPEMAAPSNTMASKRLGSRLEDRFCLELLPSLSSPDSCIRRQFRVRVSPDDAVVPVHYTADFAIWSPGYFPQDWSCVLWEVKDKRRKPHSDELIRPKLARLTNPWISEIWLATWDGSKWETRHIA